MHGCVVGCQCGRGRCVGLEHVVRTVFRSQRARYEAEETRCDTWPWVGTWGAREWLVGGARGGSRLSRMGRQEWCCRNAASRAKCPVAVLSGRLHLPLPTHVTSASLATTCTWSGKASCRGGDANLACEPLKREAWLDVSHYFCFHTPPSPWWSRPCCTQRPLAPGGIAQR